MATNFLPLASILAYLDPGSGSLLIQLIVAGALGAVFILRSFFFRLFGKIRNLFKKQDDENQQDE